MSDCANRPRSLRAARAVFATCVACITGVLGSSSCSSSDKAIARRPIDDVLDSGAKDGDTRDSSSPSPRDAIADSRQSEDVAVEADPAPADVNVDAPRTFEDALREAARDVEPPPEASDAQCPMDQSACCCQGDVLEQPLCSDGQLACPEDYDLYFGADCTASVGPCSNPGPCFHGCLSVDGEARAEDELTFETTLSEFIGGIDRWVFDFEWSDAATQPPTVLRVTVRFMRTPSYEITESERTYSFPEDSGAPLEIVAAEFETQDADGGRVTLTPVSGYFTVRRSGSEFIGAVDLVFSSDPASATDPDFTRASPNAVWGSAVFFASL